MANSPSEDKKDIVKLAHIYFQEGKWDRALNEYRKILAIDPDDMNTHSLLGDIYVRKDIPQAAYEAYNRAVTGLMGRGQVDKAMNVYRKIVRLNTSKLMEEARNKIALAVQYVKLDEAVKMEKFEESIEMIGKIQKAKTDDPIAAAKLVELEVMILQMPPSVLHYQTFGDLFLKHNLFEKAQAMFRKISELDTKDKSVRVNMAQLYLKRGAESDAKKEYLALAEESLAENNLDEALEFAQKAIEIKSLEAYFITGTVHFKKKKWADAKTEFEKLLRVKVNHLGGMLAMAQTLDAMGDPNKAKEFFHKALMIDKESIETQEAWAEFCVRRQDKETAIPNLTVLLDKAVLDKQTDRAIKYARMLTTVDPNLIFPHAKLVQLLQSIGDNPSASAACLTLATIYEKREQYEGALEYLEKSLELDPGNEQAHQTMEALHQKLVPLVLEEAPPVAEIPAVPEPTEVQEVLLEVEPVPVEAIVPIDEEPALPPKMDVMEMMREEAEEKNESLFGATVIPINPGPLEAYAAELQTAEMCIKQGLLKAAIDIYHQLLDADPSLEEIRQKLNDVNAKYLKKWMESKVIKAPVQPNPFLVAPPTIEKKSNTNR